MARTVMLAMSINAVQYDRVPVARNGWVIPVVGHVSSRFGVRLHPIKKVGALFHDGFGAPYGAPVYAMSDGVAPRRSRLWVRTEVVLSSRGGITTVSATSAGSWCAADQGRPADRAGRQRGRVHRTAPTTRVRVNDRSVDPIAWLRRTASGSSCPGGQLDLQTGPAWGQRVDMCG